MERSPAANAAGKHHPSKCPVLGAPAPGKWENLLFFSCTRFPVPNRVLNGYLWGHVFLWPATGSVSVFPPIFFMGFCTATVRLRNFCELCMRNFHNCTLEYALVECHYRVRIPARSEPFPIAWILFANYIWLGLAHAERFDMLASSDCCWRVWIIFGTIFSEYFEYSMFLCRVWAMCTGQTSSSV